MTRVVSRAYPTRAWPLSSYLVPTRQDYTTCRLIAYALVLKLYASTAMDHNSCSFQLLCRTPTKQHVGILKMTRSKSRLLLFTAHNFEVNEAGMAVLKLAKYTDRTEKVSKTTRLYLDQEVCWISMYCCKYPIFLSHTPCCCINDSAQDRGPN